MSDTAIMKSITLKYGKTWPLNTAYQGDCLDFMKELPDKCIDLVLTDPPYGLEDWNNRGTNGKSKNDHSKTAEWDKLPPVDVFNEMFRVSKNQIIWGWQYFTDMTPKCNGPIVWYKQTGMHFADGELAFCSVKNAIRIIKISRERNTIHATQKPLKLFKWCLEKYAPENAIVFDPFLGSFTTAVACHSHGLNWIGCEKDEDYFKAGQDRYETECLQKLLQF